MSNSQRDDNFDPLEETKTARVQKDDGEYDVMDAITDANQNIPEVMVLDDESLAIGERYAQNSDGVTGLYDVVTSPGGQTQSARSAMDARVDNYPLDNGKLINSGEEDEAIIAEVEVEAAEFSGYGSGVKRSETDAVIFDSIPRDTEGLIVGDALDEDDAEEE
jgi:hypothetical protein